MGKDGNKEENTVRYAVENLESENEKLALRKDDWISNIKGSNEISNCRDLLVPNVRGLCSSMPKDIATFDETYALLCLKLIRSCELREGAWKFVSGVDSLTDDLNNLPKIEIPGLFDSTRLTTETRTEIINSAQDWTFGSVMYGPSMISILQSSLLRQFGSIDFDVNYGKASLLEASETVNVGFADSSKVIFDALSRELKGEGKVVHRNHVSPPTHKRVASTSSSNSNCSDRSSSPASVSSLQGMLQCMYKKGMPHLVFSADDKEVLLANPSEQESSDGKVMAHVYTFHSRKKEKKECDLNELDFETIGKMEVSTSITIDCNNNTETVETRFVLSVPTNDGLTDELQISKQNHTKHKRLTKKLANVFKSSHSFKRRSYSKFEGSSDIPEDSPRDPPEHMMHHRNLNPVEINELKHNAPNLELAAIVVRDVFENQKKEADPGGWGLKFLKRSGHDVSQKSFHTPHSTQSNIESSTGVNAIIPAGVHGGPRTKVGGPSSLIERWANGGKCECGGWDIGCPLTILNVRSSDTNSLPERDSSGKCRSVNLFIQGSKQDLPVLTMMYINKGLYYLQFQSTLSILQCFAIAASMLHSQSPLLRSKVYRN